MRSEAWVWRGGSNLALEPWEVADPGPGQALLAVRAAGICSTDLHVLEGSVSFVQPPHVMGHEGAGEVVAVGPGVPESLVGGRFAVDTVIGCGQCRFCQSGRKHLCREVQEIGQTIPGMWARHCLVPARNLVPIADTVSFAAATQMETVHCVLGGVDRLHLLAGETAIVLGCGITGILFARLLRLQGAAEVVVTGTRPRRLAMAREYGASLTINVRQEGPAEVLAGRRFDAVVETIGSKESIATAGRLADNGGRVLLFGIPAGHRAEIDVLDAIWRQVTYMPTGNAPQTWPRVAALVNGGLVDLEPLTDCRFAFEELDQAVRAAREQRDTCIKAVVESDRS
ncbi:MAG: alcohol dehydrogenase catalytic domain-containing protein [Anaerolineae bacterium]|nr:alcohol dehydrogenase catalytic domain-containing protein [Anaerolineae bacterium]